MKLLHTAITVALLTTSVAHAQTSSGMKPMQAAPSTSAAAMPPTEGEVKKIDKPQALVVLKHGDILNLGMPAMTMGFNADPQTLDRLKLGDKVRFNADMVKGKATITKIEVMH